MATSGIIGTLPVLDINSCKFEEWVEILEAWFEANGITDEGKKRAALITSLGNKGYHTLRALLQPNKPSDKTYAECITALTKHYSPKPSEVVLRYKFFTRRQQEGETIAQFVAGLRQLSDGCRFTELENMLRDRLVVGCREPAIQRKLLSEAKLTFEKSLNIATAMETANRDVEDLKQIGTTASVPARVNKVQPPRKPKPKPKPTPSMGNRHSPPKETRYSKPKAEASQFHEQKCWRCGGLHAARECPFLKEKCFKCDQVGHTRSQCDKIKEYYFQKHAKMPSKQRAHHLEEQDNYVEGDYPALSHLETQDTVNKLSSKPYQVVLDINNSNVSMELDTGSPWTLMSSQTYSRIGKPIDLQPCQASLKTYTGSPVPILGEALVSVKYATSQPKTLPLLVVAEGANLIGRLWIEQIPLLLTDVLPSQAVHEVSVSADITSELNTILSKHQEVFDDSVLGHLKGFKAKVYPVKEDPKFFKAAPMPYATRRKVDKCLDDMLEQGIIEAVKYSDYACPIVVAPKPNGQIRVCGNYKVTANQVLRVEQYPLPTLEDMMQDLQGGKKFSKIDLSHAYHQIELDEEARKYTTINTHRGLYQYTRLPFGLALAPALFQRTIESLIADIPMCRPYLDDIIITGRDDAEHLANLQAALQRLGENGMKLKKEKCEFLQESVTYLGHRLDEKGMRPVEDKVQAIRQAPEPSNQEELRAYLGLLGYYRKFLPDLSTQIAPLTQLLKAEYKSAKSNKGNKQTGQASSGTSKFRWGPEQRKAFAASKKMLESNSLLVHFDPQKPLLLQTDASPYGLGAVISHVMPDGSDLPIAFASRTLSPSERNYAQYEKESLSIIFGLKKFHKYLHGHKFSIVTDHKPLVSLFGDKPASPMASARVARWHMILSGYDYDIVYKAGPQHTNADALSRLPVNAIEGEQHWIHDDLEEVDSKARIGLLSDIESRPVDAEEIKVLTDKDPVLSKVRSYILHGWPDKRNMGEAFAPYKNKREELSVEDGVVMWGHRVVMPRDSELRSRLANELHATHQGIVKMKMLARSYLWWPCIDQSLESLVKECSKCQEHQKLPTRSPIHPWEFPEKPWQRLHIDYASIEGKDVLVVVDAYSKWIDATPVFAATSAATIRVLRRLFANHGIPETIASDNGTPFVSEEFFTFLTNNGVHHVQTAPKHPSSNGLAERAVQTVKHGIKKNQGDDLETRLQKFLLHYRVTPQATTTKSPSELLYRRQIRTKLDLIRPNLARKVKRQQSQMKQGADRSSSTRTFQRGDSVLVKNFSSGPTWLHGRIQNGSASIYDVQLKDGRLVRRHVDHIRRCSDLESVSQNQPETSPIQSEPLPAIPVIPSPVPDELPEDATSILTSEPTTIVAPETQPVRVSSRIRRLPERLNDYIVYK